MDSERQQLALAVITTASLAALGGYGGYHLGHSDLLAEIRSMQARIDEKAAALEKARELIKIM